MKDELHSPESSSGGAPVPAGSTIEILEQSDERLVLFIPSGPKRGWELGCFGLIWLTIISIITSVVLIDVRQRGPGAFELLFLVPFWLVGLAMLYFSLRMRHTRTLILIEPTRAVLQQTFFGRTNTRETTLAIGEPATLVESYRQNDVPIDAVCLKGDPRPLKFATPLEHKEKAWIVDRINAFLGVSPALDPDDPSFGPTLTRVLPENCSSCGGSLSGATEEVQQATCPFCGTVNKAEMKLVLSGPSDVQPAVGEFPADRVTVTEQTPDLLEFGMRVFESRSMRRGAALAFVLFALFWNSIVGTILWATLFGARFNASMLFMLVFILPFVGVGVAIVGVALFILAGRLSVRLDRDALRASWGVGPLAYTKSLATETITHVTVENSPLAAKNRGARSRANQDTPTALVWAGERWIPITMLQGANDCRHVAQLVRSQLADMGFTVESQRTATIVVRPDEFNDNDESLDDDDLAESSDESAAK
ncbi:hypothetical protein Pan44_42620 [Caulifigura coniformis]|uniref:Double zinc ribbon n=1 Tax=Caulifigura coniformis TaxID=2527983 RepID=A0A517SJA5_9PLAN|nr:hypothetical protein [Caulifigura coniformis]QDT56210.1 hypothetical protein Pan44_42620 [Caulifigura coniformis]